MDKETKVVLGIVAVVVVVVGVGYYNHVQKAKAIIAKMQKDSLEFQKQNKADQLKKRAKAKAKFDVDLGIEDVSKRPGNSQDPNRLLI